MLQRAPRVGSRFRFSLRTVFAGMTGLCALLAWGWQAVHDQRLEDRHIQQLEARGFRFSHEPMESRNGFSAAAWLNLWDPRFRAQVVGVTLNDKLPSLKDLEQLGRFEHLREVRMRHSVLPVGSLGLISRLPRLTRLDLAGTKFSHDELQQLREARNLTVLKLEATTVSNRDLLAIGACTALTTLNLARCEVADVNIGSLGQLPRLRHLDLAETGICDKALERIAGLSCLTFLDVSGTRVSNRGLAELCLRLPRLNVTTSDVYLVAGRPDLQFRRDRNSATPVESPAVSG